MVLVFRTEGGSLSCSAWSNLMLLSAEAAEPESDDLQPAVRVSTRAAPAAATIFFNGLPPWLAPASTAPAASRDIPAPRHSRPPRPRTPPRRSPRPRR